MRIIVPVIRTGTKGPRVYISKQSSSSSRSTHIDVALDTAAAPHCLHLPEPPLPPSSPAQGHARTSAAAASFSGRHAQRASCATEAPYVAPPCAFFSGAAPRAPSSTKCPRGRLLALGQTAVLPEASYVVALPVPSSPLSLSHEKNVYLKLRMCKCDKFYTVTLV